MPEELTTTQVESTTITPAQAIQDVSALRDKIAKSVPGLIPELLKGDNIDALISSIDESRAVYERVKAAAGDTTPTPPETPAATETPAAPAVPAGANAYTEDLSQLPAAELIRRGLAERARNPQ